LTSRSNCPPNRYTNFGHRSHLDFLNGRRTSKVR